MRFLFQSGISMVQGLVISSVLAGSALIATRMIQDQKKLMKTVETRDQIEQINKIIFSVLQNREHCFKTIRNAGVINVTRGMTSPVTQVVSKLDSGASMNVNFETNSGASYDPTKIYMNGNVAIKSMTFMTPSATDPAGQNVITYPSKMRITYSRLEGTNANMRTKTGFGAKHVTKDIPIMLQVSPVNATTWQVDGCYAVQLGETVNGVTNDGNNNVNQEFCSNLGSGNSLYVWDSTANKCVLKNNVCPDKFVFAGISSTGNAVCYPVSNYLQYMVDTATSSCSTTDGARVQLDTDATGKVIISCRKACPAISVNWSACNSSLPIAVDGAVVWANDSTAPGLGGVNYTCSNGTWNINLPSSTCTTTASCTAPWGATVVHGACVTAYLRLTANNCSAGAGPNCVHCSANFSQSRCCNNGDLSGFYTYQNCSNQCLGGVSCI